MSLYDDEIAPTNRLSPGQLLLVLGAPLGLVGAIGLTVAFSSGSDRKPLNSPPPQTESRPAPVVASSSSVAAPSVPASRPRKAEPVFSFPRSASLAESPPMDPPSVVPRKVAPELGRQQERHLSPPINTSEAGVPTVARHPFWRSRPTAADLAKITALICSHGNGLVFVDDLGKAVWTTSDTFARCRSFAQIYQQMIVVPELSVLSDNRALVPIRPGAKLRYSEQEALLLLQDALSNPTSKQFANSTDRLMDAIRGVKLPE